VTTKIEWVRNSDGRLGKTWNPITGCTKISTGCKNCYAERMSKRLAGRHGYPSENPFQVTLHRKRLEQPESWRKPLMIFLCSMSDFFHKDVPLDYNLDIIRIIRKCSDHTFQILTKRSDRMLKISKKVKRWPDNVWLGVTVEAKNYKKRITHLKQVDCAIKFLSCEPLLEDLGELDLNGIDWVIVGGESGPGARPMYLKWATNLRDQCVSMGIPFFFKQWGGINKKANGRILEGKKWSQIPNSIFYANQKQLKISM
jgi:protein gp37